jgi:excisionase family DNA binding protein
MWCTGDHTHFKGNNSMPKQQASVISSDQRLLTIEQVATLLAVSRACVRKWMVSGVLPRPLKLGRLVRWERDVISDWLAQQRQQRQQRN